MRWATKTSSRWYLRPLWKAFTPSLVWTSSSSNSTTRASSACRPALRVRSRRPFWPEIMRGPSPRRCGIRTCSARETITSSCRTTASRRITSSCPSSSSWPGRPASRWPPPTTPTICGGMMPRCRASCSASRPERPFRTPTGWSSRPMSFTSKPPMRCMICSQWCRRPAPTPRRSQTSVSLTLISATPRSPITKPRTGWTIRHSSRSSAGTASSAATAPTSRSPTRIG